MLVISLTSIPPRFGQLPRVLAALKAQGADRVSLTIPRRWARFDPAPLPQLPEGIEIVETEADLGPAGKLLPAARAHLRADILYCDDDWLPPPGWADRFRTARTEYPEAVIAASSWPTERIGRAGGTIAQGFSGVLVAASLAADIPDPPPLAWAVDDIWFSGHFAAKNRAIVTRPGLRAGVTPLAAPGALQATTARDAANRAAAAHLSDLCGIWPEMA